MQKEAKARIKINQLLQDAGWRFFDDEDRAGVTLHTIAKIETGSTPDPRVETLREIADALGVSVDDLIQK